MTTHADPMNAIGKPIPDEGREAGYRFLRDEVQMDPGPAWECVGRVARAFEGDSPFVAQKVGLFLLGGSNLIAYYRLAATMLATVEQ